MEKRCKQLDQKRMVKARRECSTQKTARECRTEVRSECKERMHMAKKRMHRPKTEVNEKSTGPAKANAVLLSVNRMVFLP